MTKFKYIKSETGPAYWGPGDEITFLLTGADTDGAMLMVEISVPPEGGPPPHIHHNEEESFYIRQGELTILAGDRTLNVTAGDFVHIPRKTVHCFKNVGKGNQPCW